MLQSNQILSTKLFIPQTHHQLVMRSHLRRILDRSNEYKLTLISAPPGYGKTTLVTEWRSAHPQELVAWVSLDETDSEPLRFFSYLLAALHTIDPEIDGQIEAQLTPAPSLLSIVEIEAILTATINSVAAFISSHNQPHLFLVLDDYHTIQNDTVHAALSFLLERMPPQMHLIITTRLDPALPLHQLRARNQLQELRIADLRFNLAETTNFIEQQTQLKLSADELAQLSERTEGWAVGLQLAALSLKGRKDVAGFIKAFSGSNRFILEYLTEEVLKRQPLRLRNFLLQTSLLERFNASLAEAVTGMHWSKQELAQLEQANLFLTPLDETGEWYRYHHLFADFLQLYLQQTQPASLPTLHKRASRWFEENGLVYEAIQHALASGDYELVARLLEPTGRLMLNRFEHFTLEHWLVKIPRTALYAQPILGLFFIWIQLYVHNTFGDTELFEQIEAQLRAEAAEARLGELFTLRALVAAYANNLSATISYAEQALQLLPQADLWMRGGVTLALGRAYYNSGEVAKSFQYINQAYQAFQQSGSVLDQSACKRALGNLYVLQGKLYQAAESYQQGIDIVKTNPTEPLPIYIEQAKLNLQWNALDVATHCLDLAEGFSRQANNSAYLPECAWIRAQLQWVEGAPEAALASLDTAAKGVQTERLAIQIEAFRGWVGLKSNKPVLLEKWYNPQFLADFTTLEENLVYQYEPGYMILVRVLLQQSRFLEAFKLLTALESSARTQGRIDSLIKILLLLALAHKASDNQPPPILAALQEALTLAEPGGYRRVFLNEGTAMQNLLEQAAPIFSNLSAYITKILAAFPAKTPNEEPPGFPTEVNPRSKSNLVEPLTERELEVLRLIADGATNKQIADRLVIALSTVKKHNTNILDKLGVTSRTQALLQARKLDLL